MKIIIINGPNLNLLGKRNPEIYGTQDFESYLESLRKEFKTIDLSYFQNNSEGKLIDKLHETGFSFEGIILNPAAYTHYSYAIADAIEAIETPVIEVHISDIMNREDFRKKSVTAPHCIKQIMGKGLDGYKEAIKYFVDIG